MIQEGKPEGRRFVRTNPYLASTQPRCGLVSRGLARMRPMGATGASPARARGARKVPVACFAGPGRRERRRARGDVGKSRSAPQRERGRSDGEGCRAIERSPSRRRPRLWGRSIAPPARFPRGATGSGNAPDDGPPTTVAATGGPPSTAWRRLPRPCATLGRAPGPARRAIPRRRWVGARRPGSAETPTGCTRAPRSARRR